MKLLSRDIPAEAVLERIYERLQGRSVHVLREHLIKRPSERLVSDVQTPPPSRM